MSSLDFSAAVHRVIAAEISVQLAPYRELLDHLAALLEAAPAAEAPPPRRLRSQRATPPPPVQATAPVPVSPEPAHTASARPHPRRSTPRRRSASNPSLDLSAPPAAEKVQAVKPFVRRRAKTEGSNGASAQGFDPFDARIAKRFVVGQAVRYRGPDGFIIAKITAIDGVTGILTLVHPKDDTRLTIPAGSVFSAV